MVASDALTAAFAQLETEGLILRRPIPEDVAAHFAINSDRLAHQHNPSGPVRAPEQSQKLLARDIDLWERHGFGYWAVSAKTDAAVIGFGGIGCMTWREREILNVYYRFTPRVWGHGYAGEVVRAAIELGQRWLPDCPIVVRTRPANSAARRVAEKCGLERRPDLDTEHVIYALGW